MHKQALFLGAMAVVFGLMVGTAQAADRYSSGAKTWDTTTDNWGDAPGVYSGTVWNNATPDNAFFEGTVGTVSLGEPISVSNLRFTSAASGYILSGNTLNFASGGSITMAVKNRKHTITSAITGSPSVAVINGGSYEGLVFAPSSGSQTLGDCVVPYLDGSGDKAGIELGGSTTGNSVASVGFTGGQYGTLWKTGTGTWTVGNVSIGTIRINAGVLVANGYIRYYYAGFSVNSGAALHYNNPGAAYNQFTMNDGSFLDNSSGAAITTSTYNPPQSWGGNWTFIGSNGASSDLYLGTGAVTLSGNRTVTIENAATTLTVAGPVGDGASVFGLTKAGAGTLKLTGNNTYKGATTVNAGTLSLGNGTANTALNDNAAVHIASGATLDLDFTGSDTVFALFLNGVLQPAGTYDSSTPGGYITGSGSLVAGDGSAPAGIYYWDGPNVGGNGNNASDGGSGIWSTSNANWDHGFIARQAWTDSTANKAIFRTAAGTVDLQSDITLGEILIDGVDNYVIGSNPETQSLHFGGTAFIKVDQVNATIRAGITGSPDLLLYGGGADPLYLYPDSAGMTLGNVTVGGAGGNNPLLYLGGAATGNSIVKVINANNWSRIFKQGAGTWTLGDVAIGGLNIQAGKLVLNGTYTPSYTPFQTFTGGTLAGTGSYNTTIAVTVPAAGTIAPGNPTGTLTIPNLTINGKFLVTIDAAQSPVNGMLASAGTLTITSATLDLNIVDSPGGEIVIATYGTLVGTFASDNLPADWSIDYNYNSENKIVLVAPPRYNRTLILVR